MTLKMLQDGSNWMYSNVVKEHFFHPQNLLEKAPKKGEFDGFGEVGSPACGDVMRVWIKVSPDGKKIKECKWQTFGCASAIAATSMMSVIVTEKGGMTLEKALKVTPQMITDRLGGLPTRKIHCSVLGDQALQKAIGEFRSKKD